MEGLKLPVAIKPQAKANKVLGIHNGRLKIAIAATPVDGKANKELICYIAQLLKIRKQEIEIVSGLTSHLKLLHLPSSVQSKIDHIITTAK